MRPLLLTLVLALSSFGSAATICIDPGHPSENGIGTKGKKITEVKAAWLVALELKKILVQQGHKVVLTKKSENEKVTNKKRAEIANNAKADLMLRLHCDAANASGFASHYPDAQGKAHGVTGPSLQVRKQSKALAAKFHPAVITALRVHLGDRGLMTDRQTMIGKRQGALTGSIFSKVPVILVEMAVLQNAKDDAFMASAKGRETMAKALAAGVKAALAG